MRERGLYGPCAVKKSLWEARGGKRCTEPDCDKAAERGGWCSGHGANALKRMPCEIEGCCQIAQKGVYCQEHARDFCGVEGCGNIAQKGGFCQTHQVGGHPTCRVEECGKWPAKGRMCKQHFKEAQDAASGN